MTIVEFLTARYTEAEKVARAVKPLGEVIVMGGERHPETFGHSRYTVASADGYPRTLSDPEASKHFARYEPAEVLADLAAKRAILDEYERIALSADTYPCAPNFASLIAMGGCLKILALPFADHDDYDQAWTSGIVSHHRG
ncbi:MAG TPA: DUF6221 family protein [Mycobacterium sp.]|uniref:DUF6221 family protein n=1 Tax=Mycobacterium sp. TaxID=1785 RepID=UPI002F421F37